MPENKPEARTEPPTGRSTAPSGAVIGWRIGMLLYWIILAAILAAGALSIIPQAFGIGEPSRGPSPSDASCARQIRELKAELLERTSVLIVSDETERAEWLGRWDEKYRALGTDCGTLEPARRDLKTLRLHVESMTLGLGREEKQLMRKIDRALEKSVRGDGETPQERE